MGNLRHRFKKDGEKMQKHSEEEQSQSESEEEEKEEEEGGGTRSLERETETGKEEGRKEEGRKEEKEEAEQGREMHCEGEGNSEKAQTCTIQKEKSHSYGQGSEEQGSW